MQYVGAEMVGADELDGLMSELGISGEGGVGQRRIVGNPDAGRPRAFPFGFPTLSLLTVTSGTMTNNADRDGFLAKLLIVASTEALASQAGSYLTSLLIGGRNALIGAGGFNPLALFSHDSMFFHRFGVVKSGNPVVATVYNATAGTVVYGMSFQTMTID